MNEMTDEERRKVVAQVDYFIDLVSKRYEVSPQEVIEAVKWVRERKQLADKVKSTGMFALIGLLVSALSMAVWEGVKAMVTRNVP